MLVIDPAFRRVTEVQKKLEDPRNRRIVGAQIRLCRARRDIGQSALAGMVNMPASKLCKIENGTQKISPEDATALSDALGVALDELLAVPEGSEYAAQS